MRNFRTFDLAVTFYRIALRLPVKGHLKDQLSRAAESIALNLAEGRGKPTVKDQKRFFHMAFGSVRECQAIFDLAQVSNSQAKETLDALAAHLYRLIQRAS